MMKVLVDAAGPGGRGSRRPWRRLARREPRPPEVLRLAARLRRKDLKTLVWDLLFATFHH